MQADYKILTNYNHLGFMWAWASILRIINIVYAGMVQNTIMLMLDKN